MDAVAAVVVFYEVASFPEAMGEALPVATAENVAAATVPVVVAALRRQRRWRRQ